MTKLAETTITYNLGVGGVDQKTDEKFAPLGRPREMANVRFPKTGLIAKRNALAPATSDTVNGTGTLQRLLPFCDGLLAIGKTAAGARALYSLVKATDGNPLNATLKQITGTPPVPRAWVDDVAVGNVPSSGTLYATTTISAVAMASSASNTGMPSSTR